jgi:Arm domain-containing DNA-binding protein/integrase-like protein
MPKLKMTTPAIDRTTAPAGKRVDYFDDHRDRVRGLVLRVSGRLGDDQKTLVTTRSWSVVYRVKGTSRLRRLTIGDYPTWSLADARTEAEEAVKIARRGDDPAEQRKATAVKAKAEAERDATDAVEAVTEEIIRRHLKAKGRALRYIEETRRNFDLHVLPKWRGRTVKSVTRRDVATLLNGITDEGKPIAANRVLSAVRAMFNWALRQGLVDANPAALVERPGTETRRERVLTAAGRRWIFEERRSVNAVVGRIVERPRQALAGNAVALNIAQMKPRSLWPLPPELHGPRFDDDTPLAEGGVLITRGEHASDPRAAPDPVAMEGAASG